MLTWTIIKKDYEYRKQYETISIDVFTDKKESKVLTVPNTRTDSTDISDYFLDFKQSVPSVIPSNKETVEIEVLQNLSNSDRSMEYLGKFRPVN